MDIVLTLMKRDGLSIDDALAVLKDMRRRVVEYGEDSDAVLAERGFEPDMVLSLVCAIGINSMV